MSLPARLATTTALTALALMAVGAPAQAQPGPDAGGVPGVGSVPVQGLGGAVRQNIHDTIRGAGTPGRVDVSAGSLGG